MICPNCHNQIPDNSPVCPMCGTNFTYVNPDNRTQMMPQPPRPQPANKTLLISVIAIVCVLICAIIVLAVIYVSDDNKAQTEQTEQIRQTQTTDGLDPTLYDFSLATDTSSRAMTSQSISAISPGTNPLPRTSTTCSAPLKKKISHTSRNSREAIPLSLRLRKNNLLRQKSTRRMTA